MRKLLISVLALTVMVGVVIAQTPKQVEDFEDYKAIRGDAKAAFADGDYEKAAKLYEKAANSKHAEKLPYVKAWQLNSAAYSLIKADKKLAHALELLIDAKAIADEDCLVLVEKNIAYCEERLK